MENEKDGNQGEAGNAGDQKPIAKRRLLSRTQTAVIAIGLLILFLTSPGTIFQPGTSPYMPIKPVFMSNGPSWQNEPVGTVHLKRCPGPSLPGAECGYIMYVAAIRCCFHPA